jgi:hypothetical protein
MRFQSRLPIADRLLLHVEFRLYVSVVDPPGRPRSDPRFRRSYDSFWGMRGGQKALETVA